MNSRIRWIMTQPRQSDERLDDARSMDQHHMAQQTTVALIDDIDGTRGTETVQFGLDGVQLEIDLNAKNAKGLRKALAEFVAAARPIKPSALAAGRATSPVPRTRAARKAPAAENETEAVASGPAAVRNDKEKTQAVRTWAQENGLRVAARGRIAADVFARYDEAHAA